MFFPSFLCLILKVPEHGVAFSLALPKFSLCLWVVVHDKVPAYLSNSNHRHPFRCRPHKRCHSRRVKVSRSSVRLQPSLAVAKLSGVCLHPAFQRVIDTGLPSIA